MSWRTWVVLEHLLKVEDHPGERVQSVRYWEKLIQLDQTAIRSFFNERAAKVARLGSIGAVIYQDHDPKLALERHREEQRVLLEMLSPKNRSSVLDLGCGTGRWASALVGRCADYTGIDFCSGLLDVARRTHENSTHARFVLASVTDDLRDLLQGQQFDRILSLGVMIYLNDDELLATLDNMVAVAQDEQTRIVLREPLSEGHRMTLKDHYSVEMDQKYNAIYRGETEYIEMLRSKLDPAGFRLVDHGDMYQSPRLNNRAETKQKWYVFDR